MSDKLLDIKHLDIREIKDAETGEPLYHVRVDIGNQIHWNSSFTGDSTIADIMKKICSIEVE